VFGERAGNSKFELVRRCWVESKWRKRREGWWAQVKRRNMQKPTASHLHFSELFTK
jgi:hypothetical protein